MEAPERHEAERLRRLRAIGRLREAYADALLAGAEPSAEQAIRDAIAAGIKECVIDDAIIAPALRRIGELWAAGEISVADEHLATHISIRMIAFQREAFRVAARRARQRVLLCALQDERHTVGLEMAANVLLHAGYEVRMLGADVPIDTLAHAVTRHRPSVVGFSMTMATNAAVLPAATYEVRAADPSVGIIIGGAAASLRMEATAGTAVCTHITDAVDIADGLAQRARLN
jgi:MerR family transcriptional regulator, light-induced transcriptional regulator